MKQILKNQLHLLVSIEATDLIERVALSLHPNGFMCEITGFPTKRIEKQIYQFLYSYSCKMDVPVPPLAFEKIIGRFTQKTLQFLPTISFGNTLTYKEIATEVGSPRGARAVGGACGRNPFPLFIPCHRVLAQNGIGGFTGGLEIKKRLLSFEES